LLNCHPSAVAVIAQYFRQTFTIDNKADDSPVTIADRAAEAALQQVY
jgi:3'-phosphoadenosine 5'-phosphosulfate (PAPS) 3'-phosphatase